MKAILKRSLFLLVALFMVAACSQNNDPTPPPSNANGGSTDTNGEESPEPDTNEPDEEEEIVLLDYFMPDGSKAHYQGEGNEFAELDIETYHLNEQYVVIDENNGGSFIRKIYKVTDNKIAVVSEEMIDLNEDLPTIEELEALDEQSVFLELPLEVGQTIDDWTIIDMDATVETPFQTFNDAIVLEMVSDGFTNTKYIVQDYGEVLRETIMESEDEGDEDFIVRSSLKSVEEN